MQERADFLKRRVDALEAQKQTLLALASVRGQSATTREEWAQRLDRTLDKLRNYSHELRELEEEGASKS